MNYVKLNLGGKERGAKLGLGFLENFTKSEKIPLDEILKQSDGLNAIFFFPKAIFYAFEYNCKRAGETVDFTKDDVMDWIDEDGGLHSSELAKFIQAFTDSLGADLGKTKPQKTEATTKKKNPTT